MKYCNDWRQINEAKQNLTRSIDYLFREIFFRTYSYNCHTTTLQQRYLFFEQLVWFVPKLRGFVLRVCLIYLYKILSVILQHSLNTNQTLRLTESISSKTQLIKLHMLNHSNFIFFWYLTKFRLNYQHIGCGKHKKHNKT